MTADFLDLLLDRESRAAPLAEPRLASGSATPILDAVWSETIEEQAVTGVRQPTRTTPEAGAARPAPTRDPVTPAQAASPAPPKRDERSAGPPERGATQPLRPGGDGSDGRAPARIVVETQVVAPGAARQETNESSVAAAAARPETVPATPRAAPADALFPSWRHGDDARRGAPAPAFGPADKAPPTPAPVIIRIDRIEVRAAAAAVPSASAPRQQAAARVSLEDYLNRRSGGGR